MKQTHLYKKKGLGYWKTNLVIKGREEAENEDDGHTKYKITSILRKMQVKINAGQDFTDLKRIVANTKNTKDNEIQAQKRELLMRRKKKRL